jgi:hypothetical protein
MNIAISAILTFLIALNSFGQINNERYKKFHSRLEGNNIIQFIKKDNSDSKDFIDPVDDTTRFKLWRDNIYLDTSNQIFILTETFYFIPINDTTVTLQYYRNCSDFFDLKTYKLLKGHFFINKNKVYRWWRNSDGDYPQEIEEADAKSFIPFDSLDGGRDNYNVFFGDPIYGYKIIRGTNTKKIKVFSVGHGDSHDSLYEASYYFVDNKSVYFGNELIPEADGKSFRMVNSATVDAEDKFHKYYNGKIIK